MTAQVWRMTKGQYDLLNGISDGRLSYLCGSRLYRIIDAYVLNVMVFAECHPEYETAMELCLAYNLTLRAVSYPEQIH